MYVKDLEGVGDSTNINNLFDVKGKVVVITGGARGIGLMIAQGFVANGAKVIISSRSAETCEEAVHALNKMGPGTCYAIPGNLSKDAECKRVAEEIAKKEKFVHILVNNAGANWGEALATYPDSAWDRVLSLNVKSIFHLTRYLVPLLEAGTENSSTNSRVINIGSIDGFRVPVLETYAYSTSKAAVHHLTKVMAARLAPKITVNAIAAGGFETKMMAATLEKNKDMIEAGIPIGRLGTPADISGLCLYLSSKASEWMTGAVIALDGGVLAKASSM